MKTVFTVTMLLVIYYTGFAQQQTNFKQLDLLTGGSWHMKTAKGITGETWKKASTTQLQNQGFKINLKGDTSLLETVKLVNMKDDIYYISQVPNQNKGEGVPFKLTESANRKFVFTNPAHDFPQRIVYEFVTTDSLHAWIDGQYNGKFVKQDFYYKRVK